MSAKKQSVNFIKWTEAALMVVFFVLIWALRLYFYAYSRTERLRWLVLSILPTARDKKKSHKS